MNNSRKKKNNEKLRDAFGKLKDDVFDFEQIEKYFRKKDHSKAFQVLSDKTCDDLDFQELFKFLDRTNSKVGQQYLYDLLRTVSSDAGEVMEHEKQIDNFTTNTGFRLAIQHPMSTLSKSDAFFISSLFQDEHVARPKWFFVVPVLSFTSLASLVMMFFRPQMFVVLIGVFIVNIGIHYWNKYNLYQYLGSIPQLLRLNSIAHELHKNDSLRKLNPNLQNSISIIDTVRNRMSFFKLEAKLQGDIEGIIWAVFELFKILFLLEPLLLFGVLRQLDTKRKEIEDVFVFVGKIDSLLSVASLRKGLEDYCFPTIHKEQKNMVVRGGYHPLIPNCVENSIHVNQKSILLTGSNMSGKTSFIRAIGINVITGLTINTCFAKHFSMPRMKLFSAIRISDDLMNSRSYYFEEVLTIKEMIDKSKAGIFNLFLLDEIFKGTNTVERISAGKAVLSYLSRSENIVFVSTHDIELADLLSEEYELYHFSESIDHRTVDFDYTLKAGKLKNRNAIRILQINDYPEQIIMEAIELSKTLDKVIVG